MERWGERHGDWQRALRQGLGQEAGVMASVTSCPCSTPHKLRGAMLLHTPFPGLAPPSLRAPPIPTLAWLKPVLMETRSSNSTEIWTRM